MDDLAAQPSDILARIAAAPPPAARTAAIAEAADGVPASHYVPWRGALLALPVARLSPDTLVYRAENGRILAELEEHAQSIGAPTASLTGAQDSQELQRLLHGLLLAHASDPTGPILQELARHGQQTEPLLVTTDGVLVNGNRRLAAMRELMARDPERYAGFGEVQAAVLPADTRTSDMEAIEAALQMAPDTKLGYAWTNRRLKMRRQSRDLGLSRQAIVDAYRLDDPSQIDRELAELELAEDYLANYAQAPHAYSTIGDAELLFVGLAANLAELPIDLRRAWRLGGFSMIHGRKAVTKPMDREFPFAPPVPAALAAASLQRLAEERGLAGAPPLSTRATALDPHTAQAVEPLLADPAQAEAVAPQLFELMGRLRLEFQEERTPARMLRALEKARAMMEQMTAEAMTDKQKARLQAEVTALQAQAASLLNAAEAPVEPASPVAAKDAPSSLVGRIAGVFKGE